MQTNTPLRALVVLSGGQDSTTCLVMAVNTYGADNVHTITFDYGQRHRREIDAAYQVAFLMGIPIERQELVEVGPILKGSSPLTNNSVALEQYSDFAQMDKVIGDRVEKTFVPMRNALFLTLAANRAAVLGARVIVTGVCEEDNANYPDCREDFIREMETMVNTSLGFSTPEYLISISTPLIKMRKADAIRYMWHTAGQLGVLAFTHTAYDGQYPPVGHDHASILRAHSFEEAGLPDPLVLRAWMEGLMELPITANYVVDCYACQTLCAAIHAHSERLTYPYTGGAA